MSNELNLQLRSAFHFEFVGKLDPEVSQATESSSPFQMTSQQVFQLASQNICLSPGRVNLIGEHMDYNGGESLPFAIDLGLQFKVSVYKRISSSSPTAHSLAISQETSHEISHKKSHPAPTEASCREELQIWVGTPGQHSWIAGKPASQSNPQKNSTHTSAEESQIQSSGLQYLLGSFELVREKARTSKNLKDLEGSLVVIEVTGNLPAGAGLSSSAAYTLGLIWCFAQLQNIKLTHQEMALLAQSVEHRYAGTPCGLMDQIAILETPPGGYLHVAFHGKAELQFPKVTKIGFGKILDYYSIGIFQSGQHHNLSDGAYALRRAQCEAALNTLKQNLKESSEAKQVCATLGDLYFLLTKEYEMTPSAALFWCLGKLTDPIQKKRVQFVFEELRRVQQMSKALLNSDFISVHELLWQAQDGLKSHYEVSCPAIDCAVSMLQEFSPRPSQNMAQDMVQDMSQETSQGKSLGHSPAPYYPPLLGPRMMGGGFGGSLILFVLQSQKAWFAEKVESLMSVYTQETGCKPAFFYTQAASGLKEQKI